MRSLSSPQLLIPIPSERCLETHNILNSGISEISRLTASTSPQRTQTNPSIDMGELFTQRVSTSQKPGHMEILLILDRNLSSEGKGRLKGVHNNMVSSQRHVFPMYITDLSTPRSIEWRRIEAISFESGAQETDVVITSNLLEQSFEEAFLFSFLSASELFGMLEEQRAEQHFLDLSAKHSSKQLTIILLGLDRWKKSNSSQLDCVSAMEDLLIWIELESGCHLHRCETVVSAASYTQIFTEAIAEAPYK